MMRTYIILFVLVNTAFNFSYAMQSDGSDKRQLQHSGQYVLADTVEALPIEKEKLEHLIGLQVLYKKNSKKYELVVLGDRISDGAFYKAYRSNNAGIVCSRESLFLAAEQKDQQ
jgi:hypothetical protein